MKLALVISSLQAGGAERVMSLLASQWARRGDDVTLLTLDSGDGDHYPLDPRVRRIVLRLARASGAVHRALWNNARRLTVLRRTLQTLEPDVVVSFGEQTNVLVLIAAAGTGLKCVVSERTDPAHHRVGRTWGALRRLVYPRAHALVVQSRAVAAWATPLVGADRVHVIPNPVRALPAAAATREKAIVGVGALRPEKGFHLLLEAYREFAAANPGWLLTIVGEGPERARLESRIAALKLQGRVTLLGKLREPAQALASAGIYVQPSLYEGFPNALLEAMSCGLPVVSTATAGASEMISDGVDGVLVPPGSSRALAEALTLLAHDEGLRHTLGKNARAVSTRYGIATVIERWNAVFAGGASSPLSPDSREIGRCT